MKRLFLKPRRTVGSTTARVLTPRFARTLGALLLALGLPLMLTAQTVKGVISDPDGETLIGVNVLIKGTSSGTVTDFDGNYEVSAKPEDVLVFSYTGYTTEEVLVGAQNTINIVLAPDAEILEEVVVVGYGVVRKSDLTGSVAKIGGEELTAVVAGNPTSALQGKLSGVQVENNGGEPGGATNVFVRGVASFTNSFPLYVIDGTFADNMNLINPKDIESIEVLKDASSAAIYGSRAANGVVLVTTKRGGNGDGTPTVSLDVRTGVDAPARMLDFLNGDQFAQYRNQLEENDNTGFSFSNDGVSTDWQDLSLNSGAVQDYGLSVSGGTENSRYYISGNYFDQDGILVGSDFNRANLRANSEFNIGRFTITESLSISQSQTQSNNWFGFDGATAPHLRLSVPENDGGFEAPNFDDHNFGGYNDYALATLENNQTTRRNVLGNLKLSYELAEGLSAGLNLGMDYVNTNSFLFMPTYFMSNSDATVNQNPENDLNDLRAEAFQTQVEPTLNYNRDIGANSRLNAVIGATAQRQTFKSIGVQGQNTPGNDIRSGQALDPTNILAVLGENNVSVLQSFFGRVNYSLNNRYLFSATLRRDASSRFAESNRVGYFPSASVGWNVSNEEFWNRDGAISRLKVRAGYGELGAQNIPDYAFQPTLGINSPTSFGGAVVPGFAQTRLVSPDVKWEVSKTSNFGVDVGLWNDKLAFSAEYYIRNVSDVLVGVRLPASSGTALPVFQNAAGIRNKGFELDGVYRAVSTNAFKLNFAFNFSTFNSEVTELPNPLTGPSISEDATVVNTFRVGEAPGAYFGFETIGVYADQAAIDNDPNISDDAARRSLVSPGDFIRKDQNGDGIVNGDDQVVLGDPTPDFIYGFNFTGSAGKLDFGVFFQGSQGNEIYNVNKFYNIFWADDNKLTDVLNAWTPTNTNTDIPRSTTLDQAGNRAPSSFFVEDASYLRLRTLEVGYKLGTGNVDWLKNLRVFVTAQNLLTLTGYSGYNPDISSAQGGRAGNANPLLGRGLDVRAYPLARTFMVGVQAGF